MADPLSYLQQQIKQAREPFEGDFYTARKDWERLLDREFEVAVEDHLKDIAAGSEYRSPDLKKQVRDWVSIGKSNPTYYNVLSTDTKPETKRKLRNVLLWIGRGWEYENEGRVWDRHVIEGQCVPGLAICRLMWHPQVEPDVDAGLDSEAYVKARSAALKKRRYPFYWSYPSVYGVGWLGDEDSEYGPDFFVYESEVPYIEAREKYSKEAEGSPGRGMKLGYLSDLSKVAWVGQDDTVDERWLQQKVKVTVVDKRDLDAGPCPCPGCDHPMRKICIYVCGTGYNASEADLVEEYTSPFPGCSFFIVGGDIRSSRDPHKRFVPVLYESFIEGEWTNSLTTKLVAMMLEESGPNRYYGNYGESDPVFFQREEGMQLEYDYGKVTEGKIQAFPFKIERMPSTISPHMITLLNLHRERLEKFSINRFLTGDTAHEASNATGTAFLQTTEQAGKLPSMLAQEADRQQMKSRRYVLHAIKYWGTFDPEGVSTPYTVPLTGNDSYVKYTSTTKAPGEVATIDADMLNELDFDIVATTKTDTLQEQGARYLQAKDKYQNGYWTFEQVLRDSGVDDIQGQLELLDLRRVRENFAPIQAQTDNLDLLRLFAAGTGIDFGPALTGQVLGQNGAAPPSSPPQNGVAPTGVMGSPGTAIGIPGNNLIGRTINQPAGGSSPVRGQGNA